MSRSVSIIGSGVVGTALGRMLKAKGYTIKGVVARSMEKAAGAAAFIGGGVAGTDPAAGSNGADWVFITTPDRAIEDTCKTIAAGGGFDRGALVVHMSGALSSEVLASAREAGARVVSIHPIQSLASVEQAVENLPGSYFSMEGDGSALDDGREIVDALGGRLVLIPSDEKAIYHAGAVVASNYLVAVVDLAVMMFESLGMDRVEATKALLPLVQGTVNNIGKVGVPDALTGPIARGDVGTVEGHIEAIRRVMPGMLGLYCELGRHTVDVGLRKGSLSREAADKLLKLLGREV